MIWHIFKKDWKLLWPMVAGVALINVIHRVILSNIDWFRFDGPSPLRNMSYLFGEISLFATALLVVTVVLRDAIPGFRQDWLIRPIRRRDLMLSKILFVVLLAQCPIFITEVGQGLAAGFPFWQSVSAPFSRSLWMLLAFDLPLLAFATLTRNLTEAMCAALAVFLGLGLFITPMLFRVLGNAAIAWVVDSIQLIWGSLAVAAVLGLQYYGRKIIPARWVCGGAALVWLCAQLLPWQAAFAVQQRVSSEPEAANPVQITFVPGLGRLPRKGFDTTFFVMSEPQRDVLLYVPLRMSNVGAGRLLNVDQMTARVTGPGGQAIELPRIPPRSYAEAHQLTVVPVSIYNGMKDQPVRLDMDYSLTLLQADPEQSMPALDGDRRVPGVGRCATRTNPVASRVELGCLFQGNGPIATWFLESTRTAQQDAENMAPSAGYAPYFGRLVGDSMNRFSRSLPYQGEESQLKDDRVVFRVYRPLAHFTRRVVIPNIRLSDWTAQ
jgi:hypothetical protein